jgi:zinc/manganese transport system substrate-binding protein
MALTAIEFRLGGSELRRGTSILWSAFAERGVRWCRIVFTAFALVATVGALARSPSPLNVFTCEPEWAALVRRIAPEAQVFSATHALQDPHEIEARPALIAALRRADLAVCTGAGLEAGWLPMLQDRAGNPRVMPGAPGMFIAAEGLRLIEDAHHHPERGKGHVHSEGNPHFHLDPVRFADVATRLTERLATVDPHRSAAYRSSLAAWLPGWNEHVEGLKRKARPLFGAGVIAEHSSFAYLFRWLELYQVADLEPVPGVPPTPSHLRRLLAAVRDDPPSAVIQTLYQDPQSGRWLAERLRVPVLRLPSTVTVNGPTATPEGLFEHLVQTLLHELRVPAARP